jgi:hypothetical protein
MVTLLVIGAAVLLLSDAEVLVSLEQADSPTIAATESPARATVFN